MPSLTKLVEIHTDTEQAADIYVCDNCQDTTAHTITPDADTKDGVCEWKLHV